MGEAGGSAERRASELHEAGDPNAKAWAAGADGERRVAEILGTLGQEWVVLHDRLLWPGMTDSNVDHVVVGPGGIFLIDTKNRSGDITVFNGGLFQHTVDADGHKVSRNLQAELRKATWASSEMTKRLGAMVVPVICMAGSREGNLKSVRYVQDVSVVPATLLTAWLRAQAPRMPAANLAAWATRVMTEFPSTTTEPELLAAIGADLQTRHPHAAYGTRRPRQPAARTTTPSRTPRASNQRPPKRKASSTSRRKGPSLMRLGAVAAALLAFAIFGSQIMDAVGSGVSEYTTSGAKRATSGEGVAPQPTMASAVAAQTAPPEVPQLSPCARLVIADLGGLAGGVVEDATLPACTWAGPALNGKVGKVTYATDDELLVKVGEPMQQALAKGAPEIRYARAMRGDFTQITVASGQTIDVGSGPVVIAKGAQVMVDHSWMGLTKEEGRLLGLTVLARMGSELAQ